MNQPKNRMERAEILAIRIDKICAVIDSLKLYDTHPQAFERLSEALVWTPESEENHTGEGQ
ncbi:hypothetical protein [Paenibacillus ehimensis]|uniref:Uncharacterized protein n=1 Tax=Paenibacillus ehimensis TaxID=79264 RepID=A0ABT8VLU8_9BACL|nr:hypothetical protein [Paenibacillus ehimensis]MDO3681956.1 hypothetical protein [Paenibacillus ehimensis]